MMMMMMEIVNLRTHPTRPQGQLLLNQSTTTMTLFPATTQPPYPTHHHGREGGGGWGVLDRLGEGECELCGES